MSNCVWYFKIVSNSFKLSHNSFSDFFVLFSTTITLFFRIGRFWVVQQFFELILISTFSSVENFVYFILILFPVNMFTKFWCGYFIPSFIVRSVNYFIPWMIYYLGVPRVDLYQISPCSVSKISVHFFNLCGWISCAPDSKTPCFRGF